MGAIGDPVGAGVVSNLAHPGGNITGLSALSAELEEKRLELLKEIAPGVSHVGVLLNLTNPYMAIAVRHARLAAQRLNVSLRVEEFRETATLESALDNWPERTWVRSWSPRIRSSLANAGGSLSSR
jgi:putative ABC transport system substrate-binding protein